MGGSLGMLSGDLVRHIKRERAQRKIRPPLRPTLFARISGLVRKYALGESFLRRLDDFSDPPLRKDLTFDRERAKEHFEPPLFSLSTEGEYRVTVAIINKVNNPYLHFVNSPDEILLCGPLFRRNPSLGPGELLHNHFETLLMRELVEEDPSAPETLQANHGGEK